LTGDHYFPGGMGEFIAAKDSFLKIEKGPSVEVKLQWASFADAADECALSRQYAGVQPAFGDVPGRILGIQVAKLAFAKAAGLWEEPPWYEDKGQLAAFIIVVGLAGIGFMVAAVFGARFIYSRCKLTNQGWSVQMDHVDEVQMQSIGGGGDVEVAKPRTDEHDPELE